MRELCGIEAANFGLRGQAYMYAKSINLKDTSQSWRFRTSLSAELPMLF
jgi:hypothetical protein